jgi:hypothetical protein
MQSGKYEYQSDFAKKYVAQGRAEGLSEAKAAAVLAVLEARGLDVPAQARERIVGCRDLVLLDRWIVRAVSVSSIEVLFTDEAS